MSNKKSEQASEGFLSGIKGCLTVVVGIGIAVRFFNSCSNSKSSEADREAPAQEVSATTKSCSEDAEDAMAAAYILGAINAAENNKVDYLKGFHTPMAKIAEENFVRWRASRGESYYECIYCGAVSEHSISKGGCPESRSGMHRYRLCRGR